MLDPEEPEHVAQVRRIVHRVRVQMVHAALRLGYDPDNALVKQVLYRLNLAEKLKAPWRRGKRPDPVSAAAKEAQRDEREHPAAPLGFTIKVMLLGMQGTGKTQLAHALLGGPHASVAVHPFDGATRSPTVLQGSASGIGMVLIDTPGLSAAAGAAMHNCNALKQIVRAYHKHRPDLLVYVDRLDDHQPGALSAGGSGGQLSVLKSLSTAMPGIWLNTIIVFTHAGASPPRMPQPPPGATGAPILSPFEYWMEIRSHSVQSAIRQASGDERLMNPVAFSECHPACTTNASGQPILYNGIPWREHLLLMVTSAKLLADTEVLLQMGQGVGSSGGGAVAGGGLGGGGAGGGASDAMLRQMLGMRPQIPLPYIMQQVVQRSKPLRFPDHQNVMDLRRARHSTTKLQLSERQQRDAARQIALRTMQLRQVGGWANDSVNLCGGLVWVWN